MRGGGGKGGGGGGGGEQGTNELWKDSVYLYCK